MAKLKQKYGDRAHFLFVYTREPHAGQMQFRDIEQPKTYEERLDMATRFQKEANPETHITIDDMKSTTQRAWGGLPNMGFVIGTDGKIQLADVWANPKNFEKLLKEMEPVEDAEWYR